MNLRSYICLDLGTAQTKACNGRRRTTSPSVAVRDNRHNSIIAVGKQALETELSAGRELVHPVQGGAITDYEAGRAIITNAIRNLLPWWTLFRPTVVISKSQLIRPAQLQQIKQAVQISGGGPFFAADVTSLAALGAEVDSNSTTAKMVADIGAGTTEVAIMVRGNPVVQSAESVGGRDLETAIKQYVYDRYGIEITAQKAKDLLTSVGSATETRSEKQAKIKENNSIEISSNEIVQAIDETLQKITQLIRQVMQESSAALLADIAESGIVLTGGVAQLSNLDTRVSRRLYVPVSVAKRPELAVVRGAKKSKDFISVYKKSVARNGSANRKRA